MIGKLRVGKHEDAGMEIKHFWETFCLKVIPSVVPMYKKNMQLNAMFSDVVTKAQEAMVLWLLQVCYDDWVKEWKKDEEAKLQGVPVEKRTKPRGRKNFATLHAETYNSLIEAVDKARADENTGKGWDAAIREAASKRYRKNHVGAGNSVGSESVSGKKRKLVIEIKDNGLWK